MKTFKLTVFNIRSAKYASALKASGVANRWNKDEEFVVYAGSSIALSTLELIAHRSAIHNKSIYKLLVIDLNINNTDITEIALSDLPPQWKSIKAYPELQEIGSRWYQQQTSLLLKVPSALVQWEHNYLINTKHPGFPHKVFVTSVEDFEWDERLLS